MLDYQYGQAIYIQVKSFEGSLAESGGIFSRLNEEMTKPERIETERHKATLRKYQQLDQADNDYQ